MPYKKCIARATIKCSEVESYRVLYGVCKCVEFHFYSAATAIDIHRRIVETGAKTSEKFCLKFERRLHYTMCSVEYVVGHLALDF